MKLIVILGPTSSGKSTLAIKLAHKFKGEIISADSRQVYKGMDLGTGKVTKMEQKLVPHHLLDIVSPKKQFTVSDFKLHTKKAVARIVKRRKVPFLVGGTAFYIYSFIDNWEIPEVKPNLKLRTSLGKKTAKELFAMLKKLDPRRAKNIDKHNPVRLIRAIEIIKTTGQKIPVPRTLNPAPCLILGIKKSPTELRKLINKRVNQRLKAGMVKEVKRLLSTGITFKRLEKFGLEYRYIAKYLQGKLNYEQMVEQLKNAIWQFAKRQMTWFKRDSRIHWVMNQKQAEQLIKNELVRL